MPPQSNKLSGVMMRSKLGTCLLAFTALLAVLSCVLTGMHVAAQRKVEFEDAAIQLSRNWVDSLLIADEKTINHNITKMLERTDPSKREHINEVINLNIDLAKQGRAARLVVSSAGIMTVGPQDGDEMRVLVTTRTEGALTSGPTLWLQIKKIDGRPAVSDLGDLQR